MHLSDKSNSAKPSSIIHLSVFPLIVNITAQPFVAVTLRGFILKCSTGSPLFVFYLDAAGSSWQVKYGTQRASPTSYDKVRVPTLLCLSLFLFSVFICKQTHTQFGSTEAIHTGILPVCIAL